MDCKEILLFINISYIFGLLFETHFWLIVFQFNFESLFRSLHYALMDNCCREYLFLVDFYMASGTASQDLFNAIMSKTLQTYLVSIHKTDMHHLEFCTDVLKSMYMYYHTPIFYFVENNGGTCIWVLWLYCHFPIHSHCTQI